MSTEKPQSPLAHLLSEHPLIPAHTEPAPLALPDPPNNVAQESAAVDAPTDAESAARRAQQAKSLLAGLDLDTAIRLRWAMRDIRAKRTNWSPVSENDLAALIDLGLVE